MAKKFHARPILKPEKSKEQEKWEEEEDKRQEKKKTPTSIFDGINEDRHTRAMEKAIMMDISQEGRDEEEEDDWCEERN